MTMKTFSALIKPYKRTTVLTTYILTFLTPVIVVINYLTIMSVIVVNC